MSNYISMMKADIANFRGFRTSIWLSGCRRHCKGCFNSHTWDFKAGQPLDEEAYKKLENELKKEWCRGLSILGGEPLEPENLEAVRKLSVISRRCGKDTALWTGYYIGELSSPQLEALEDVDYIIDRTIHRRAERHFTEVETAAATRGYGGMLL